MAQIAGPHLPRRARLPADLSCLQRRMQIVAVSQSLPVSLRCQKHTGVQSVLLVFSTVPQWPTCERPRILVISHDDVIILPSLLLRECGRRLGCYRLVHFDCRTCPAAVLYIPYHLNLCDAV